MNCDRNIFFGLIRSSLWNEPCPDVPSGYDWRPVLSMAKEQTLLGLVADALRKYPKDNGLDKSDLQILQGLLMKNIQAHAMLDRKLAETVKILNSAEIPSVLFKGQGLAINYPDPFLRQCGDIDLYVGDDNYDRACELLVSAFGKDEINSESVKHYHMMTDGVTVELHRIAETMPGYFTNKRFQKWTIENLHGSFLREVTINDTVINLPPFSFDPIYILNHAWHHFMNGGIGLRQICDWAVYLHCYNGKIDVQKLQQDLDSFRLKDVWQAFAAIAVRYLGLPAEECPLYNGKHDKKVERILEFIMSEGNFGQYDSRRKSPRPKGYAAGKLHSFRNISSRFVRMFLLFPMKTLQYWMAYFINGIYGFLKGLL